MYHEYPYTTYYGDIDAFCKCLKAANLRLDTHGDYLRLINSKNEVLSSVKVSWAETALLDEEGRPIKAYLVQAGVNGNQIVFTHGDNTFTTITVPFATKAQTDVRDQEIVDYVYELSIAGDKVRITNGDAGVYELTIPFATKAATDVEGKDLTSYAATLAVDGNELVLRDSKARELSRITVNFAVKAQKDVDGDDIKSTYGNSITQSATTIKLLAKDGTLLSEQTVNYATTSLKDTDGNLFLSDYAEKMVIDGDGKRIGLEAHDGTRLATITVPFATLATDATNAIEQVEIVGDQIVFTTYGGVSISKTIPYAVKAQKDALGNTIANTYVANVGNDTETGALEFYDATGTLIAELVPTVNKATHDSYDNLIADYVKTIVANSQSDYVTITHGDGTVDSIKIMYSEVAYKDTNNNVIKNTYIKRLAIVEDNDIFYLVAYNGDNPEAELFRIALPEITAAEYSGLVINNHEISLTTEVKNHLYDFTVDDVEEELTISVHTLTQ